MQELVTEAIVLNRQSVREYDELFSFYSENEGYFHARAISSRKLESKFSPHLDIFSLVTLRLVNKNSFLITDVIVKNRFPALRKKNITLQKAFRIAEFINATFPEGAIDVSLWRFLQESFSCGDINMKNFLALQGYDAYHAMCMICKNKNPNIFFIEDQSFFCKDCISKISKSRILYI